MIQNHLYTTKKAEPQEQQYTEAVCFFLNEHAFTFVFYMDEVDLVVNSHCGIDRNSLIWFMSFVCVSVFVFFSNNCWI